MTQRSLKLQNFLLLVSSCYFYACWDYRFLFLLLFSIVLDYYTGLKIEESANERLRKTWLTISITVNLGFLCVFKYYNFFAESLAEALALLGLKTNFPLILVVLPVGISFYTFHGLSYVIDIYKRRISAVRNFVDYSVFVSFFPLLVAGPIERATHLLPQIQKPRVFQYNSAVNGMKQILWGLFKKVVVADNCATYADMIFNNSSDYSGSTLLLGALLFAVQIYCDFSGYSDIALGTARLLGIELLRNFAFPYFSRDIAEFWRRWHISLSSWFRDYLYIPLGGSKRGLAKTICNTFVIFLVSGFWHGANWTFITWGALHAGYFLPLLLAGKNRTNLDTVASGRILPNLRELTSMVFTFLLVVLAWIFFRADSVTHAVNYLARIFSSSVFSIPTIRPSMVLLLIMVFFLVEWLGRESRFATETMGSGLARPLKWGLHLIILSLVLMCMGEQQQFIYFQF